MESVAGVSFDLVFAIRKMGNQVTRVGNASHKKAESATVTGNAQGANTVARSASKSEPDHNSHMQFLPIESLAKVGRSNIYFRLFHCFAEPIIISR